MRRNKPCPLYPQKRTCAVEGGCPLWANSGHLHSAFVPHVLAMVEDGNDQTSNQQRAANDSAREINVMSGASDWPHPMIANT